MVDKTLTGRGGLENNHPVVMQLLLISEKEVSQATINAEWKE